MGLQVAATRTAIWLINPGGASEVERIDVATKQAVTSVDTGPQAESLAVGDGSVWVINQPGTSLVRIDSRTNKVVATIDLSGYPGRKSGCACHNVAVGAGAVWAIARDRTLVRIDPQTDRVTAAVTLKRIVADVAVGDRSVWVGTDDPTPSHQIDRVNPQAMNQPST